MSASCLFYFLKILFVSLDFIITDKIKQYKVTRVNMELDLNIEQLHLKSEFLHTNPRFTHYHEDAEKPLFVSWDGCVTVLYSLDHLAEATLWNPVNPVILQINNPVLIVLTFDSKVYCIDKMGCIYYLKLVQRDSPDLFDCSPSVQVSQKQISSNYKWVSFIAQKYPCDILGATCYTDGIALITAMGESIILQFLQITINDLNIPVISNKYAKHIRQQNKFPFLVYSFKSCAWRNWFSSKRAIELFGPDVLDSQDILILSTEESKIYCGTSDVVSKNVKLFLNCPQKIIHIQLCDYESKKLLLISSSGIITVMHCVTNIPTSFIYLNVTKVVTTLIVDHTVILSDGVNLFIITLDKQFSKIIKQVVTPLKGVLTLHKYQFINIIAMTQINKVYKLSTKYDIISEKKELKFKFNEKSILENIKCLCKNIESLEEQQKKMNEYTSAMSLVARKDLVAEYCSLNVLIYSGAKAVSLGAHQDEYTFAIKISTDCSWLSFPASSWQLLVRVTDSKRISSNCGLYTFNVDSFSSCQPLLVKHHLSTSIAKNCASGLVYCELVCQIQNDLINNCLVIPLNPIKLNSLYFVKVEKREKIPMMNPFEYQHKNIFKYPENLSLSECITIITNKNKHRTSKSLNTNITDNLPKTIYFNFFGKFVSVILDDKITKSIVLECIDRDTLIEIRNGFFNELSLDQPAIIKYAVFADLQKQLCLLEELSVEDSHNENMINEIKTKIQNQISIHLPV